MELNRNNKLVRWAYICEADHEVPSSTNLCRFFWRIVLVTPLQCLLIILFSPVLPFFILADKLEKWSQARRHRQEQEREPGPVEQPFLIQLWDLFVAFLKAKKKRFCPTIQIR